MSGPFSFYTNQQCVHFVLVSISLKWSSEGFEGKALSILRERCERNIVMFAVLWRVSLKCVWVMGISFNQFVFCSPRWEKRLHWAQDYIVCKNTPRRALYHPKSPIVLRSSLLILLRKQGEGTTSVFYTFSPLGFFQFTLHHLRVGTRVTCD